MVMSTSLKSKEEIVYPDSDGERMADNTEQFNWIVAIKLNLEWLFANDPNVFIAGDLLWYPVEGDNKTRIGPDTMVAFGRPKGRRGSYMQWIEANIAPQVVFEVLSPGNRAKEMQRKLDFYAHYGVEEYYIIDPDRKKLKGYLRKDNKLEPIFLMDNWISPRLKIRFTLQQGEIQLYRPDGAPFQDYVELAEKLDQERILVGQEREKAQQERERANKLAEKLRAMGIDPDKI
jgi:Uma2 family endonuclease